MPILSAFTPCGMLAMSSAPSHAEQFYDELVRLYGANGGNSNFDFTVDPLNYDEAKLYAWAMGLARVQYEAEHAGNQAYPLRAYELIPLLELDFQLTPGANDTVLMRQNAIQARELLPIGAVASNIVNALKAILGANFLAYVCATPNYSSGAGFAPTIYPANPDVQPGAFADVRTPARLVQIIDPVTAVGSAWCAYKNLDTTSAAQVLRVGDVVVVQGENTMQCEKVTITGVAVTPPVGSFASGATLPAGTTTWVASTVYVAGQYVVPTVATGVYFKCLVGGSSGTTEPTWPTTLGQAVTDGGVTWTAAGASLCFQATFAKSHDAGATVTTGNFPYWWSTQRFYLVVVQAAAAVDPETRRRVNEFMDRIARGCSGWAVVQPTSTTSTGGTVGPLTVGAGMATIPLGTFTYVNSN